MTNLRVIETDRVAPARDPEELRALIGDVADWQDMLVLGYDADGHLVQRSTRMTKAEALMLIEQFKHRLMNERPVMWGPDAK